MTEDEMVGWHHQLYGHESEQVPGIVDGQGGLAAVHGVADSDMTQRLNLLSDVEHLFMCLLAFLCRRQTLFFLVFFFFFYL